MAITGLGIGGPAKARPFYTSKAIEIVDYENIDGEPFMAIVDDAAFITSVDGDPMEAIV